MYTKTKFWYSFEVRFRKLLTWNALQKNFRFSLFMRRRTCVRVCVLVATFLFLLEKQTHWIFVDSFRLHSSFSFYAPRGLGLGLGRGQCITKHPGQQWERKMIRNRLVHFANEAMSTQIWSDQRDDLLRFSLLIETVVSLSPMQFIDVSV